MKILKMKLIKIRKYLLYNLYRKIIHFFESEVILGQNSYPKQSIFFKILNIILKIYRRGVMIFL